MTVLGHLEGKDKDEVIGNLTDEQKLHLFRRWFTGVSSYFSPEELVESPVIHAKSTRQVLYESRRHQRCYQQSGAHV